MNVLYEKGFLHRDFKCENILVDKNGIIKIADLGLVRKLDHNLEVETSRGGTPYTMAPEIFFFEKKNAKMTYTFKSDLFSVATVLHMILYDYEHPFNLNKNDLEHLDRVNMSWKLKKMRKNYGDKFMWI